jgi:hypothetical protein
LRQLIEARLDSGTNRLPDCRIGACPDACREPGRRAVKTGIPMRNLLSAAALALVLAFASTPSTAVAQGTAGQPEPSAQPTGPAQPDTTPKRRRSRKAASTDAAGAPAKKEPSPAQKAQREKMKACGAEWKASGQKGRAAYSAFLKECLKKKT